MIKSLILYTQFFTSIPLPFPIDQPVLRMKKGVIWFTLFGGIIGAIEALFFYLVSFIFPIPLSFFMTLFFDVLLTGGFHLDALCDSADGLFSARKKERMLEIMKDSRIGSNGVLAIIFYYGLLMGTVISFQGSLSVKVMSLLVMALGVMGKAGISLLFIKMRYAGSTQGLGTTFLNVPLVRILFSQVIALMFVYYIFNLAGLAGYLAVVIVSAIYKRFVYQKVDGLNGDTLGAFACISQVIFCLVYLGVRSWLG